MVPRGGLPEVFDINNLAPVRQQIDAPYCRVLQTCLVAPFDRVPGLPHQGTWRLSDVPSGIPPEGGIEAAYKRQLAEAADPAALRAEINARIECVRGPIGPLNRFGTKEMVDPRDTGRLACEWVADAYRIVRQPSRLQPRARLQAMSY
jgi:hypothetical protein